MGSVKPVYIKRVAIELIDRFPDQFNSEFEHNKVKVQELTDVPTLHLRNKIAGYITRYYKKRAS